MVVISEATRSDIVEWFGAVPYTMRAMVAKDGDRIVAVCALANTRGQSTLISECLDEFLPYKKLIVRGAKKVMEWAKGPVLARSDPRFEGKMLKYLGFERIEHPDNVPPLEWWIWHGSH